MQQPKSSSSGGGATVKINHDHIIVCVLRGAIDEAIVRGSLEETRKCISLLQAQGRPALLLIESGEVTSQTSGARSQAKTLGTLGLAKIAVVGPNPALGMVIQYLIKSGGMGGYAKVFGAQAKARQWLLNKGEPQQSQQLGLRLVIALMVMAFSIAVLVGWGLDSDILKEVVPGLKAMNPVVAILFILFAILTVVIRKEGAGGKWRRRYIIFVAAASLIFGTSVLLRALFGIDTYVDEWLFTGKLNLGVYQGVTAPRAAYNFILLSIMVFSVMTGQRHAWQRYTFHITSAALFINAVLVVAGYAFGVPMLNELARLLPMPLNTAICFLLLNYTLQIVTRQQPFFNWAWRGFNKYSSTIIVAFSVLLMTGLAWQSSRQDLQHNDQTTVKQDFLNQQAVINDRIAGYVNALRGYRSFFESSDFVEPDEYKAYFDSSRLTQNYPGFNSIVFVRSVPAADKQKFTQETRKLVTSQPPGYHTFSIYPASNVATSYPIVYIQPQTPTTAFGFDLSGNDTRRMALEAARDTGLVATTGTIDLNASRADSNLPKRPGFFMAVPVYSGQQASGEPQTVAQRQARIYGFVNAYFEDGKLFGDIFKNANQPNVRYVISNARTNEVLYTYNPDNKKIQPDVKYQDLVQVAGQTWQIQMYTTADYGVVGLGRYIPLFVLVGGGLLMVLATSLMLAQARRREQAVLLAASMTEDLNNERNAAVATQQKDEAILSSIGDAVFAVDTKQRITLFNKSAERISGFSAGEAVGMHYTEVLKFLREDGGANSSFIKQALDGQITSMKGHTVLIRKDGSRAAVADSAAPIRDAQGTTLGAIIVFRDVTEEQALDRAKTEFVSLASHQLRTPLSAIGWYSEILLSGDTGKLTKGQTENVQEIHDSNKRMVDLVDALLDVSRLDLGKFANTPKPTSMVDLANSLHKEMLRAMQSKQLVFTIRADKNIGEVNADPKLLRMIIQNILSNAIKYTSSKGLITLTMRDATKADTDKANLHVAQPYFFLSIADTGYGIPKAQQTKVFEKLFRADNARRLDVEGTGLGLYIVKEVVERLGGAAWFESAEGSGTTFYVVLPYVTKATKKST